jgi:HTH-type transcriptional regulator / antitoxin HigA
MQPPVNISALQAAWRAFDKMAHLRPIHTEADYDRTVKMMNALLDVAGDDEDHPLSSLLELTSDLVSRYEQERHPI